MIELYDVHKTFLPDIKVMRGVNVNIRSGEFVSIVGRSGIGKTTLVKTLIGQEKIDQGSIVVGGWDISNIKPRQVPYLRRQIGVIFQDFKLLPKKSLGENVAFALQVSGHPPSKIKKIVPHVMKIVGLQDKQDRYPHEVSGGEAQRAAIARSLVHSPKVLLADEPTGNIDSINADEVIDLLLRINNFGTTVVLVSHNREIVNKLRKRVITIDNGMVISDQEKGKYIL